MNENFSSSQFGYDLNFLKEYIHPVILSGSNEKQQLIISPEYQGRILTSTTNGLHGQSFGWINYDLISSGKKQDHINAYGGEDRFWLGPEAGQFGIFFQPGKSFDFENYHVPVALDTEAFQLVSETGSTAKFFKEASLINYSNTRFDIRIERTVSLLSEEEICALLKISLEKNIQVVAFQSENKLTHIGNAPWKKESGLLSIWILGIQKASDQTVVVIPVRRSASTINTNYFGELKPDRFLQKDSIVFFKADGNYRSKIGIPFQNVKSVFGSFDEANNVLTIVQFTLTDEDCYVNSLWNIQEDPYHGDVVNSYNDGPLENEKQLGKFYELETSSPARELNPGESIIHIHRTFHFSGNRKALQEISQSVLGAALVSNPFTG